MSILTMQCERLRDRADELRMLASGMGAPYIVPETKKTMAYAMSSAASELNAAADTIEAQRDKLQGVIGTRYCELFGTPERAARTLHHNGSLFCSECLMLDECAKTQRESKCMILHYDALLEWLEGGAE